MAVAIRLPSGWHLAAQVDGIGHLVRNRGDRPPRLCDMRRFSEQFTGWPVRVICPTCRERAEVMTKTVH